TALPTATQILVSRRRTGLELPFWKPVLADADIGSAVKERGEIARDRLRNAHPIAPARLIFFAQTPCAFVFDCNHLAPPGSHTKFLGQKAGDSTIAEFGCALLVENRKPLSPGLPGFQLHRCVAHFGCRSLRHLRHVLDSCREERA